MLVSAGQTGMMYDFFLDSGKVISSTEIVLQKDLLWTWWNIFPNRSTTLCVLTTIPLMLKLKAIIRSNRLQGCPLQAEKEMKKTGRGKCEFFIDFSIRY